MKALNSVLNTAEPVSLGCSLARHIYIYIYIFFFFYDINLVIMEYMGNGVRSEVKCDQSCYHGVHGNSYVYLIITGYVLVTSMCGYILGYGLHFFLRLITMNQ